MTDAAHIKDALRDAEGLCGALGFLAGRRGRDWVPQPHGVTIRCPWHDERSPSCSVHEARDGSVQARCFGCGATGDALALVAAAHGLDVRAEFRRVLDLAADLAGVSRPERCEGAPRLPPVPRRPPPPPEPEADGVLDAVAAVLATECPLAGDPEARGYVDSRGLAGSPARAFYALPDGGARDRVVTAVVEAVGLDAWVRSGLAAVEGPRAGRWSFAWSGPRLVIPWRAPNGTVETLQGRYLGTPPEGVRKYVFPRGRSPRWPWGCDALAEDASDRAVAIVVGALDAVSFDLLAERCGVDARALAIPGTGAWRDEWLSLCAHRECIVALDADAAGARGADAILSGLLAVARRGPRGPMVRRLRPTTGKDWNDAWRAAA